MHPAQLACAARRSDAAAVSQLFFPFTQYFLQQLTIAWLCWVYVSKPYQGKSFQRISIGSKSLNKYKAIVKQKIIAKKVCFKHNQAIWCRNGGRLL